MESLWENHTTLPAYRQLKSEIKTDVLIIGGGIAGILCGWALQNAGVSCVIAEADRICRGVTAGTTAKITAQHGLIYNRLINEFGTEKAGLYLKANLNAVERYKKICSTVDCDFQITSSYIYARNHEKKLEKEIKALDKLGFSAKLVRETELPFPTAGAVEFPEQAQFDPLKFLSFAAKNLKIYEHTAVKELKETTAVCENGKIRAKKIVVATHFPLLNKHGSYFLKLYQKRSYVTAFEGAPPIKGMYRDESENGYSLRGAGRLLLVGGPSRRTGTKSGGWAEIRDFATACYPAAREKYRWAAQDCISLDGVPYIGHYSANTPDLYVVTGFNKWGMTSALVAAELICDLITGKRSDYERLFSPSRHIIRPQLFLNAASAVGGMVYPTVKRCPHLGCALKWNEHEHSWDCPCHGSRFTKEGKLLNNPANGDLKPQGE